MRIYKEMTHDHKDENYQRSFQERLNFLLNKGWNILKLDHFTYTSYDRRYRVDVAHMIHNNVTEELYNRLINEWDISEPKIYEDIEYQEG